jgi:hypothetical protein
MFDLLRRLGWRADQQVRVLRFDAPDDVSEHDELVRDLGALGGISIDRIECEPREHGVVVTLEHLRRRRRVAHPNHALDLERLLSALDALLPAGEARSYFELERASLAEDHAVAFADARELDRLRACGWSVVTDDAPSDARGVHHIGGLRVRGPVDRWLDGTLKKVELAEDADIGGVRCAAGTSVRFIEGRVSEATIARAIVLRDCRLPPGTWVFFHHRCHAIGLARLATSYELAGIVLPSGTELELDHEGRLTAAVLGADTDLPSGYRERAKLPEGTVLAFRDGRWDVDERTHPTRPPAARATLPKDRSALLGWALFLLLIGTPIAILLALAWAHS